MLARERETLGRGLEQARAVAVVRVLCQRTPGERRVGLGGGRLVGGEGDGDLRNVHGVDHLVSWCMRNREWDGDGYICEDEDERTATCTKECL